MRTQKAEFTNPRQAGRPIAKPLVATLSVAVYVPGYEQHAPGEVLFPVVAHWHMGRSKNAQVVYCSLRVNGRDTRDTPGVSCSGNGSAGGTGYHKQSAALAEAIEAAGITLANDIDGVGCAAVDAALIAIAEAAGYEGFAMALS